MAESLNFMRCQIHLVHPPGKRLSPLAL